MTANGWIQILLFAAIIFALTKPLGSYMFRVFEGDRQPLPRFFGPIERFLCRLCGEGAGEEANAQTVDQDAGETNPHGNSPLARCSAIWDATAVPKVARGHYSVRTI